MRVRRPHQSSYARANSNVLIYVIDSGKVGTYQEVCRRCTTRYKVERWGVSIGDGERGR